MENIKDNIRAFIPLAILLIIGVPLTIKELREHEAEKLERRLQREKESQVEYFSQPLVKNERSLQVGYCLSEASVQVDEDDGDVRYSKLCDTKEEGMMVFDNLYREICKHHCGYIAPHRYTNEYNRVFECNGDEISITLRYRSKYATYVEIRYDNK